MSPWFFTSDLHGQYALYEQLIAIAATRRPRVIAIGGDLAPHAAGDDGIERQRVFLQGFLVEFARRLREATRETDLLLLMGNDDWSANFECLLDQDGSLWRVLHERSVEIDGIPVAGLSWVPITPFGLKDWERWDDGDEEAPGRLDGYVSRNGETVPFRFDPTRRSPTVAEALEALAATVPAPDTVFVLHSPPRDTDCDLTSARVHVGSRAIRSFVEQHQPPIVLSGHIHESPRISSRYRDTIGRSVIVNPGQFGTARLCGVWFEPDRPGKTLRHTVYG